MQTLKLPTTTGHPASDPLGTELSLTLGVNLKLHPERHYFFFLLRSATTVVIVGMTAPAEIGLGGELSFLGFFASLLVFC